MTYFLRLDKPISTEKHVHQLLRSFVFQIDTCFPCWHVLYVRKLGLAGGQNPSLVE